MVPRNIYLYTVDHLSSECRAAGMNVVQDLYSTAPTQETHVLLGSIGLPSGNMG